MLPQPSASFTIPSILDGLELNCRIHFPKLLHGHAAGLAIFAHPYAPLGGNYNDPCVQSVGVTLLKAGYVLITFNFRGAEDSAGKTSWNGRAELSDYVSVYAVALEFMRYEGTVQHITRSEQDRPLLILGGYSYGSMMAANLPSIEVLFELMQSPLQGTSEYEITARASELAQTFLGYCEVQQHRGRDSMQTDATQSLGGYESPIAARRASREASRHSLDMDKVRYSMERVRRKLHQRSSSGLPSPIKSQGTTPSLAHLLVSPLIGPVSGFLTVFTKLKFERKGTNMPPGPANVDEALTKESSLIVFGSDDHFTSSRRVRKWCEELQQRPQSKTLFCEIAGAGHFWHEPGLDKQLQSAVEQWLENMEKS